MKSYVVEGIVLKRRNIGEADRILTVLTRNFGKVQIKAVGVRKISSKRSSHIEPLNVTRMGLYKGNGIPILTEIITTESFPHIKEDLITIGLAYHLCELVDGLCPEGQENGQIFDLLTTILRRLDKRENSADLIHEFEIQLLSRLGYISTTQNLDGAQASYFIESILERKLKTRAILPKLLLAATN